MITGLCAVYITASTREEAVRISKGIVFSGLAACANVVDNIKSFYVWQGKQQEDEEVLIIAKTREELLPDLEKKVKELHSYDCPCITALPLIYASEDFANWIKENTTGGGK